MDFFIRFSVEMFSNGVSAFFSSIIIIYFIIALIGARSKRPRLQPSSGMAVDYWMQHYYHLSQRLQPFSSIAVGVLTTLGILGTFTGIFLGLLDFDVQLISKSVPTLIEGLKIAFGTSILGLATALVFRILRPIIAGTVGAEDDAENEALDALRSMARTLALNEQTTRHGLERVDSAIKTGFEEQIKEFRAFSEQMSKAFSEAIIEELKAVIREFNEKISEQFGENFKQLNEAVGRLLEWQENYRIQLEELKSNFEKALKGIQSTEVSITQIAKSASSIPENIELLNEHLLEMHEGFSSMSKMRENAENAFPTISDKIADLTDNVTTTIDTLQSEQEKQLTALTSSLEASLNNQQETQSQMLDATQSAFNESISNATEKLNDSIIQLDEAMQKEIESVVRTMAENLSGITQKFVQDYNPLLEEIRKIIEISNSARKPNRDR